MSIRKVLRIVLIIILMITPFLLLSSFDIAIQNEYSAFYYAELGNMYDRLKTVKGKKIVIIGNSNVSFGLESRLFEKLISDFDEQYSVVNFGLYGAIGTKAMLDLAKNYIQKDDIVILTPEEYDQSMSLYFSAKEMWYALDSNRSMFNDLDSKAKEALIGNYVDYVAKKFESRINNRGFKGLGVYAVSSFDEHCDMTRYNREYNIMLNYCDENNLIDLTKVTIDDSFINYINEYNDELMNKGAKMYYSFSPMNKAAILNSKDEINGFYNKLREKINFPIISDINEYIMDKEWFYDSNYHLNSSGMKLRTYHLADDLKNELNNTTKTSFIMIEKPVKPETGIEGEGNNIDADCFTYEKNGNFYKIVGLTEKGSNQEELIIPYQVDGIYINEFSKNVFSYNRTIKKITIQDNIKRIYDGSFIGCDKLTNIYLCHDSPSKISVGFNLLVGMTGNVYVTNDVYLSFINDYFWGAYQGRIFSYEKN